MGINPSGAALSRQRLLNFPTLPPPLPVIGIIKPTSISSHESSLTSTMDRNNSEARSTTAETDNQVDQALQPPTQTANNEQTSTSNPHDVGAPNVDDSRVKKKARHHRRSNALRERQPCYLERMPMEILAEILSYSSSPQDILALARCSKFFCATLTNKSSDFIWRQARTRCLPRAIPEPTPNFTESSYAALIYDSGPCEVSIRQLSSCICVMSIDMILDFRSVSRKLGCIGLSP